VSEAQPREQLDGRKSERNNNTTTMSPIIVIGQLLTSSTTTLPSMLKKLHSKTGKLLLLVLLSVSLMWQGQTRRMWLESKRARVATPTARMRTLRRATSRLSARHGAVNDVISRNSATATAHWVELIMTPAAATGPKCQRIGTNEGRVTLRVKRQH